MAGTVAVNFVVTVHGIWDLERQLYHGGSEANSGSGYGLFLKIGRSNGLAIRVSGNKVGHAVGTTAPS